MNKENQFFCSKEYWIEDTWLDRYSEVNDLGIIFSSNLCPAEYVDMICGLQGHGIVGSGRTVSEWYWISYRSMYLRNDIFELYIEVQLFFQHFTDFYFGCYF